VRALSLVVTVGIAVVVAAAGPRAATADPVTDLTTQATTLVSQIESTSESITALGQEYDRAELALEQAQQARVGDVGSLTALRSNVARLEHLADERAVSDYQASIVGQSLAPLDTQTAQQLAARSRYAADQSAQEHRTFERLQSQEHAVLQQQQAAEQAQIDAQAASSQLASIKAQLEAANAQQVQLLSQVQGSLALLVPDASQALEDAQLSAALAEFAPGGVGGAGSLFPSLPPVSAAAGIAIAYARAQIGKPYLYAAAGPDSFDCSGLVMAAFAFAGIRLPHYSGAQYAMLPHVSLFAMQPGDLVFWGVGGSEHVAIYVGAGRILEAGGTGNNVHLGPIWGHPVGAARVI